MRTVIWDRPQEVGEWVCARIGGTFDLSGATAIGLEKDGRLIAGVMYDHYNGRSIAMHVAGEGGHWMTREFARACFGYAFNQLGVNKVIGLVDSTNESARRYDEHLGFRLEATITGAGRTGDLLIYSMTPEQCRWIGETHGRKEQSASST
jgi:RimJ/RimL family protein N-acetyltransferase